MRIKTIMLVFFLAVTAGVFAYTRPHNGMPSDLRDAVADRAIDTLKTEAGEEASGVSITKPENPFYVETGSKKALGNKGYVADPLPGAPGKPVEFITIPGGRFKMGTSSGEKVFEDAKPIHAVDIKTFDMSKTDVTVEQYAECLDKGECTEPDAGNYCNWGVAGRELHPINCVDWDQARKYARFKSKQPGFEGARLPSEAEWEYAATSGGRSQKYPWGDAEAACDKAVMYGEGGYGCGADGTMPVCSKTAGNTTQGLCDMAGNVWQWVQDTYHYSYEGAPDDGSEFKGKDSRRVMRGGSFGSDDARSLRADYRDRGDPALRRVFVGFRLARSSR